MHYFLGVGFARVYVEGLTRCVPAQPSQLPVYGGEAEEEADCWAEHPMIVSSVLDTLEPRVVDFKLESSYGAGTLPFEWMDLPGSCLASAGLQFEVSAAIFVDKFGLCPRG